MQFDVDGDVVLLFEGEAVPKWLVESWLLAPGVAGKESNRVMVLVAGSVEWLMAIHVLVDELFNGCL